LTSAGVLGFGWFPQGVRRGWKVSVRTFGKDPLGFVAGVHVSVLLFVFAFSLEIVRQYFGGWCVVGFVSRCVVWCGTRAWVLAFPACSSLVGKWVRSGKKFFSTVLVRSSLSHCDVRFGSCPMTGAVYCVLDGLSWRTLLFGQHASVIGWVSQEARLWLGNGRTL